MIRNGKKFMRKGGKRKRETNLYSREDGVLLSGGIFDGGFEKVLEITVSYSSQTHLYEPKQI